MAVLSGKKKMVQQPSYEGNAVLRMLAYTRPYLGQMFVCLLVVLALTWLELYRPILIGDAIDRYITGGWQPGEAVDERFAGICRAALIYVVLLVFTFICSRTQYLIMQHVGQKIIYQVRGQLFEHVMRLSMRTFDTTPVGRLVTRVTNDVESLNEMYANILVRLFRNVIKIAGLIVIMLMLNVRMAVNAMVMIPAVVVVTVLSRYFSRKAHQILRTRLTDINTFLSEHLSGMRLIQIFHREAAKYTEFAGKAQALYKAWFGQIMVFGIFRPAAYLLSVFALIIIIYRGSVNVLNGMISIGTLYIFIQYINSFFEPIQELAEQLSTLQNAVASAEKIFTLLDTKPIVTEKADPVVLPEIRGRIEFDHVWFSYDGETDVLRDVSFVIEPGQKVAFVGATGAGKSSILNLIGRYYDIRKGAIRIDGVDIRDMTLEQIRRSIGQVAQDVFLFTGDIRHNIRLGNESVSDEDVVRAAKEVHADDFIRRFPKGYDTPVAERGTTFSAGQRQLISFARTLAADPKILILDEATSNIDTETEQLIQDALFTLMKGRTSIMVAHRLSTIQHADMIMVMHKGRIRERGTHQELLAADGIYKKLYELQLA